MATGRLVIVVAGFASLLAACGGGGATGKVELMQLEVTPKDATVAAGRPQAFVAHARYSDGAVRDVTSWVSWSTSLPWVATIDSSGIARTHHQGTASIIAELGSLTASAPLMVSEPVAQSIRIEPADRALAVGANVVYRAYATLTDGSERDVGQLVSWTSDNDEVASAPNDEVINAPGTVTANSPGSTQIRASYQGVTGATPVTVVESVLYGGGETLAALAYLGANWYDPQRPEASMRLTGHRNPAAPASLFGRMRTGGSGTLVSYCQTGDDIGKGVYDATKGARADDACGDFSPDSLSQGFSGVMSRADFVAVEMPLTGPEYLQTQQIRGVNPVQVPALAATIAIGYNNPNVTWELNLTSAELCDIFSGVYDTWDDINPVLPADPIRVVYRSDKSAATFALSNHLSFLQNAGQPCEGHKLNASARFTEVVDNVIPHHWIAAASSAAAGALMRSTSQDGFPIGYGEAADLALREPSLRLARVNGVHPLKALESPVISATQHTPSGVFADQCVITGFAGSQGASASGGLACDGSPPTMFFSPGRPVVLRPDTFTDSRNPCTVLVDPDAYANPVSAPDHPSAYPILTISYLLAYNTGNGNARAAIRQLLMAPYSGAPLAEGFVALSGYAPSPELIETCIN